MSITRFAPVFVTGLALLGGVAASNAATLEGSFAGSYTITDLGSVASLPASYGGITFKLGDPNTLLIGGSANNTGGAIYEVGVTRDVNGHVTGFSGAATLFSTAPNIDGGLTYGPGGVLFYTGYSTNVVGQIKPGSTSPDRTDVVTGLGVSASVGALQFVPAGFAGAGQMKLISYSGGGFYTVNYTADGNGTYILGPATLEANLSGGPEGLVYVSGANPEFSADSALVAEYSAGKVVAFDIDANGNPIVGTARDFITGLGGAEGAIIDPLTGDFLFSTFGSGNHVVVVSGFVVPVPTPAALPAGLALLGFVGLRRRR